MTGSDDVERALDAAHAPVRSVLAPESVRAAIHALYDYKFETQNYLGSWKPGCPKPEDLCCDEHRSRFERHEQENRMLAERLQAIVQAIAQLEALREDPGEPWDPGYSPAPPKVEETSVPLTSAEAAADFLYAHETGREDDDTSRRTSVYAAAWLHLATQVLARAGVRVRAAGESAGRASPMADHERRGVRRS